MGHRSVNITFKALLSKINAGKSSSASIVNIACGNGLYVRLIGKNKTAYWYYRDADRKFTLLTDYKKDTLAEIRNKLKMMLNAKTIQEVSKTEIFKTYKEKWLKTKQHLIRFVNIKKTAEYLTPLDNVPIKELKNSMVKQALLSQKITSYKLGECVNAVCAIMDLAVEDEIIDGHKCHLLKKSSELPKHIAGSGFKWQPVENFKTLFGKLALLEPKIVNFFLFQALTGLRSGTCRTLRKDFFDFKAGLLIIPGENMKIKIRNNQRRKPFRIPLTKQMRSLYDKILQEHCQADSVYLFPRDDGTPIVERDVALPMQTVASSLAQPHGFRKSLRTWMAENGISAEIAELCIDHAFFSTSGNVSQSFSPDDEYQKSDLLDQRRQAMQAYNNAVVENLPDQLKAIFD